MHARIDQLLSLLDREPVDAAVHSHLERCASCSVQLQQLARTTDQLRALPQLEAPPQAWQQISAQLSSAAAEAPHRWRGAAAIAAVAASAVALSVIVMDWNQPQQALRPAIARWEVRQFVEQSRELEQVLESLPQRPAVERVGMAATVDSIEQRVQWLDWQLSATPGAELNAEQTRSLWRERVTLMDSLVKLRYAESGHPSFSF